MSEEVKIKISQPMFEVGELERFDNNIHNIIEEYSKLMFKEKDQILTQRIIMKQEEEIERLNNDIKVLLKENENKEKVIKAQDNIIKEVREYINKISSESNVFGHYAIDGDCKKWLLKILDKENK